MSKAAPDSKTVAAQFPCNSCGAGLEFSPAASVLKCPYCGQETELEKTAAQVQELNFYDFFARAAEQGESEEKQTVTCTFCNAASTVDRNISLSKCPFCGSCLMAPSKSSRLIKPGALLPFKITRSRASGEFRDWLSGLWFAPVELKRYANTTGGINGMYIPYWTYDARVTTVYDGQRGEDYCETEYVEETAAAGRNVTRSRQVTRTRWHHASGCVVNTFNDVLVSAGKSLPPEIITTLEPWDLRNLVPYSNGYLSGYHVEAYQLDLGKGFEQAKGVMEGGVRRSIERDIGGNRQQISVARSQYDNITFKHVLLPVWISAYRYRGKTFRFIVNARTGQVQGERPYSILKIVMTVIAILFTVLIISMLLNK